MYRVLIVDDEEAHRKGMMQLLGRMRPEYFLLEARDGKVAELILETVHIDIILTDIRMPNKNGLEFLEDLYKVNHQAKVVIVSGYGQFEYAKRAMDLGAAGFLLKPIDPEELETTLSRVEDQIKTELIRKQHQRGYIDYLLVKMVNGTLQEEEEVQLHGILPKDKAGFVFVLHEHGGEKKEDVFLELKQTIKKSLDGVGHVLMFEVFESSVSYSGIIIFDEYPVPETDAKQLQEELCRKIYEIVKDEMELGISKAAEDLYEQIGRAYNEAKEALNDAFYFPGKGQCYQVKEPSSQDVLKLVSEQENEWENLIRYSGHKEIEEALNDLFGKILKSDMPNSNRLKEIFVVFGIRLANWMHKKRVFEEYHQAITLYTKGIMNAEQIYEMQREVEDLFLFLNDILHQKAEQENVIDLTLRYMEEHLGEDIALPQLANMFFFTPSYFSIYFKNKTGQTFSQQLKLMRMEKACEMLCATNKKIGEIAKCTGYNDATYFGKVFKKHVGCSPEEYRKRNYQI